MRGANRDGMLCVARVVDGKRQAGGGHTPGLGVDGSVTAVARGRHYHYSRFHQAIDFGAQRALAAGEPLRHEGIAQTEIDPVDDDPAAEVIQFLDSRDGFNYSAGLPSSTGVQYLQTK